MKVDGHLPMIAGVGDRRLHFKTANDGQPGYRIDTVSAGDQAETAPWQSVALTLTA
jgi:hypothetical protein